MPERGLTQRPDLGGGDPFDERFQPVPSPYPGYTPETPASNPQLGVETLPPTNSSDPAPLPNPEGEYAPPFEPTGGENAGADTAPRPPPLSWPPPGSVEPTFPDEPVHPGQLSRRDMELFGGAGHYAAEGYDLEEFGADYELDPVDELPRFEPYYRIFEPSPDWYPSRSMNIVVGERTFGPTMRPGAPPTAFPPVPTGGGAGAYGAIYQGQEPDYRRIAERAMRDTAIRQAGRVIEGVILQRGPSMAGGIIGAVIGSVINPNPLGSGERSPEEQAFPDLGTDIARGVGVTVGGITLGGMVILGGDPGAPIMIPDAGDEPGVRVDVPGVEIPAPSGIEQPFPPTQEPSPWPIATPTPSPVNTPSSTGQPTTGTGSSTTTTPAPTAPPAASSVPWWNLLSAAVQSRARRQRASLGATNYLTTPSPTQTSQPTTSGTPTTSTPSAPSTPISPTEPLTSINTRAANSAPPRQRTRTRTRECHCDPKPKRRKPARECNARGQLVWASGPKKGRPAGSRCVSFKGGSRK